MKNQNCNVEVEVVSIVHHVEQGLTVTSNLLRLLNQRKEKKKITFAQWQGPCQKLSKNQIQNVGFHLELK